MISTKKIGRPKKFDRNVVLSAALNVFWEKGYQGASMADLTSAMKINGPSLYAEFGDKLGLYQSAIDNYMENGVCTPLDAFDDEPDIRIAVGAFMHAVIDHATQQSNGQRGCFLASSVVADAGHVIGIEERLQRAIKDADQQLANRFLRAMDAGDLPSDFPTVARARLMFDLRQGYVFRARSGCDPETLRQDIAFHVDIVLS